MIVLGHIPSEMMQKNSSIRDYSTISKLLIGNLMNSDLETLGREAFSSQESIRSEETLLFEYITRESGKSVSHK